MKFTSNVGDFGEAYIMASHALDRVKSAGDTKMLLVQALAGAKQRVLVFCTDGTACCLVRVAATVDEAGVTLVEPKEMGKTFPNLDESAKVAFELKANRLQFSCGNFKPKCAVADPKNMSAYLKDLPMAAKADLEVPAWKLREVVERTVMFAARGDASATQPFLQNLHLQVSGSVLEAFASNNEVMAKARIIVDAKTPDFQVDIPSRAVPALQKILSNPRFRVSGEEKVPTVKLIIQKEADGSPKRLFVRTEDVFYGTNLSVSRMPVRALECEETLVKNTVASIQLNRETLVSAFRRCEPFVAVVGDHARVQALNVSLKDNVLTILDGAGEDLDKLEGTGNGTGESTATVNLMYAKAVVGAAKEEVITLRFVKSKQAVLFGSGQDVDARSFYVVGCMRNPPSKAIQLAPAVAAPPAPVPAREPESAAA